MTKIRDWKRCLDIIDRLIANELILSEVMDVSNPIKRKVGKRFIYGDCTLTKKDLDIIEKAITEVC